MRRCDNQSLSYLSVASDAVKCGGLVLTSVPIFLLSFIPIAPLLTAPSIPDENCEIHRLLMPLCVIWSG